MTDTKYKWKATDRDGHEWKYTNKPEVWLIEGIWHLPLKDGDHVLIRYRDNFGDWTKTLERIDNE